MLTPQEISSKEFVKAVFGGYDMSVVDDFLETLTADYTALYKENAILKSKIKVLVEKVEEYRSTEDAMRMALLTAQRLGDEITSEAKKKSEGMLSETDSEIRGRLLEMKNKFADEEARLGALKDETRKFVAASQEIIRQHGAFLARLEEVNREVEKIVPDEPEYVPVSEPEEPSGEDEITAAARHIDNAVNSAAAEPDPFAPFLDDAETKRIFRPRGDDEPADDEPTSPRPKFDFDNLKFGQNYVND